MASALHRREYLPCHGLLISDGPTSSPSAACTSRRRKFDDIAARAHAAEKVVMLGGPSVSAAPEMYPDIDYLHIGEIGDATDRLIAVLTRACPPAAPIRFECRDRLALQEFPIPAYDLFPLKKII